MQIKGLHKNIYIDFTATAVHKNVWKSTESITKKAWINGVRPRRTAAHTSLQRSMQASAEPPIIAVKRS